MKEANANYLIKVMPQDLGMIVDKENSFGSCSIDEIVSFLLSAAQELYFEWMTWFKTLFPKAHISKPNDFLTIINKI